MVLRKIRLTFIIPGRRDGFSHNLVGGTGGGNHGDELGLSAFAAMLGIHMFLIPIIPILNRTLTEILQNMGAIFFHFLISLNLVVWSE